MGERLTFSAFRFLLGMPETGKNLHFPLDFRPEKNRKTAGILVHFPAFRLPLGIPETGKLWPHLEKTLRASKEKEPTGFTGNRWRALAQLRFDERQAKGFETALTQIYAAR